VLLARSGTRQRRWEFVLLAVGLGGYLTALLVVLLVGMAAVFLATQ
jgi:hypothetical protein